VVQSLRDATFQAFDAVIDLCLEREVDFLLVAGDVYDGADRSLRAQLRFCDGMQRLAERGIRAYVIHGNHDPLDGWSHALQMPEMVHVFRDRLESVVFEKEGVPVARIHGISYPSREIEPDFGKGMKREGDELFQIGVLHCNAGCHPRHDPYAPRSVAELIEAQLDYWALGHVHDRQTLHPSEPFIGYPGNTQGRHINESGPRGCLCVRVGADGKLTDAPEFVTTDRVRWEPVQFDIAGTESLDDLLDAIEDRMETLTQELGRRPVVTRITLSGRGVLHCDLARPETLADVEDEIRSRGAQRTPFIWMERLVSNTRPDLDLDSRRAGQDFLGDVLRLIDEVRGSPDELNGLSEAVKDLYQHRNAKKFLDLPEETLLRELLDEAELRCADLLAEGD
jgi:DNA repair exonuclease SbcCD nuclease subunit